MTSHSGQPIDKDEIGLRISELYQAIRMIPNHTQREKLRLLLMHVDLIIWS